MPSYHLPVVSHSLYRGKTREKLFMAFSSTIRIKGIHRTWEFISYCLKYPLHLKKCQLYKWGSVLTRKKRWVHLGMTSHELKNTVNKYKLLSSDSRIVRFLEKAKSICAKTVQQAKRLFFVSDLLDVSKNSWKLQLVNETSTFWSCTGCYWVDPKPQSSHNII